MVYETQIWHQSGRLALRVFDPSVQESHLTISAASDGCADCVSLLSSLLRTCLVWCSLPAEHRRLDVSLDSSHEQRSSPRIELQAHWQWFQPVDSDLCSGVRGARKHCLSTCVKTDGKPASSQLCDSALCDSQKITTSQVATRLPEQPSLHSDPHFCIRFLRAQASLPFRHSSSPPNVTIVAADSTFRVHSACAGPGIQ